MSGTPVLSDSTSKAADVVEPPFGCTLGDGGRGASWVRVTGELDRITATRVAALAAMAGGWFLFAGCHRSSAYWR
jgi:hypothetical protein